LIASGFLELSDDNVVDPDSAVGAIEDIAAALQEATPEEREALRRAAEEMAGESRGEAKEFFKSFMHSVGLDE
jgi:hypothetical protein